jgi:NADH-quinone oxidoreductase subunit N
LAAVDAGMAWLAVAGVIASVIGAYYYLRIVYLMYFGQAREGLDGRMGAVQYVGLITMAAIIALAWLPGVNLLGLESMAAQAAQTLVR